MIISGSVGLEPVLSQARLSAHANIYTTLDLRPWSHDVAGECLVALARGHGISLPDEIRREMCRRLRCCVPHHVQLFFHHLYEHLARDQRNEATLDDVERVYQRDLLSVRGQAGLVHYEERLRMVLGDESYTDALSPLSEAVVNGGLLTHQVVNSIAVRQPKRAKGIAWLTCYTSCSMMGISRSARADTFSCPVCLRTGGALGMARVSLQ